MTKAQIDIIAVADVRFVVKSSGFGQHDGVRVAAVSRLALSLRGYGPSALNGLSFDALRTLASEAVRKETRDGAAGRSAIPARFPNWSSIASDGPYPHRARRL